KHIVLSFSGQRRQLVARTRPVRDRGRPNPKVLLATAVILHRRLETTRRRLVGVGGLLVRTAEGDGPLGVVAHLLYLDSGRAQKGRQAADPVGQSVGGAWPVL